MLDSADVSSGPITGGTRVTVTGSDFLPGALVTLGSSASATDIVVNSSTSISFTTPAASAGVASILIRNAGGTSGNQNVHFTFVAPPAVSSVSPNRGPGGTSVVIAGSNLSNASAVTFGGTPATGFAVVSDTEINATVPTGDQPGAVLAVLVTTPGGVSPSGTNYIVDAQLPVISSISPLQGPMAGGTRVTVSGANFVAGSTSVTIGGATIAAGDVTVDSETSLSFLTPTVGTGGNVSVKVTTPRGTSDPAPTDFQYFGPPVVNSISVNSGPTSGGTQVVITGNGFSALGNIPGGTVKFGAVDATYTVDSLFQITATAPPGAAGAVHITVVSNWGGASPTSSADLFTYVVEQPIVYGLSPTGGAEEGGTSVTITGTHLSGATSVAFGTEAATHFTVDSDTQITAVSPRGTGYIDIHVNTPGGTNTTNSGTSYFYQPSPTISSVSPNIGPTAGGASVTISGTNLADTTAVTFGGASATIVGSPSATSITVTTPGHAAGPVAVVITAPFGDATLAGGYTYGVGGPTISALSQGGGLTTGGANITISGTNLAGATAVTVDGSPATIVGSPTATSVTYTTPAHAAGAVPVVVNTPDGTASTTFTYVTPLSVSPAPGALPAAVVGVPYSQTFTVSGGTAPYSFVWGALPQGFPISGTNTVSGTPVQAGGSGIVVRVRDSSPASEGGPYEIGPLGYPITIVATAQTITFGALGDASLSASPLTLSATATSGLAVAFSSTSQNVCTVSGTTLTLLTTGVCTINANQAGDANNPAAPTVTRAFTVTPATLEITAGTPSGALVGGSFSWPHTATGGVAPYTYELLGGSLPPGTTLDAATGTISGAPTTAGTFLHQLKVTDSQATPASVLSASYGVQISRGVQTLTFTSTAPTAKVGDAAYTVSATASSGLAVSYALDAASTGCAIAGASVTFTAPGTCVINANQAGDGNWNTATQVQQSFTVAPAALNGSLSGNTYFWKVGDSYRFFFTVSGGVPPYSFTGNNLPAGTSIDSATGVVTGTLTTAGDLQFGVLIADSVGAQITAAPIAHIAKGDQTLSLTSSAPSARVGGPAYTVSVTASSGLAVSYSLDPTSTGCALSGTSVTFTTTGTCRINADQAGDSNWNAATRAQHSFPVTQAFLAMNGGTATGQKVGDSYSQANTASGGVAPYTYSIELGPLPAGVTLNPATGLVSGAPTMAQHVIYQIRATDSQATPGIAVGPFIDVTIGKGDQTLAFTSSAPSARVSGTPYIVGAAATSGLAVSYTLDAASTGCALSGMRATFTGTGTCRINADQAGDSNWNAATRVQQSFAVSTADAIGATIDFSPKALVVGARGALEITFDNPNAVSSQPFDAILTVPSLFTQASGGGPGGCTVGSTSVATATSINFNGIVAPPGRCTITLYYTGALAGSAAGFALDVATPTGYPTTPRAVSASVTVAASVTGLSPSAGQAGQTVTISGAGFSPTPGDNVVRFGGLTATVSTASATALNVVTPAGTGATAVTVTVNGQISTGSPTYTFLVAPPVAADKAGVEVAYGSSGATIDLSSAITSGPHGGVTIVRAPEHGATIVVGDVVTYTPASDYSGADSFTYSAVGPGGASNVATVSLTVAAPPAPAVADKSVEVVHASQGTTIDLSGAINGVHSSLTIAKPPAHGVVTIAGDVVTYTPAPGYSGVDSFTYSTVGPGGASNVATVSLTVAAPPIPVVTDKSVQVVYGSAGTTIDLSGAISGVHSSLTIVKPPAHGVVTIKGDIVTYAPTAGYYGVDGFTFTVTGPGGASVPASVSLTVGVPPPPSAVSGPIDGGFVNAGTSLTIDLTALVTGAYDTIQIYSPPAHGTVTLSGGGVAAPASSRSLSASIPASPYVAIYTPAKNFAGPDSFAFVAVGPGGASAPASVTISVVGQVPTAPPARIATTGDGQAVSVMLTDGAAGGPFVGAAVVSVSPADAATTAIVASGSGPSATYRLDVTPSNRFDGKVVVAYTLSNAYGASAPSTVTLTVQARPDPRNDPDIGAMSDAQAETTRRFARTQVSNFMRRNEQLHQGGGRSGMAMGVTLAAPYAPSLAEPPRDKAWDQAMAERMRIWGEDPTRGRVADGSKAAENFAQPSAAGGDTGGDGKRLIGSVGSWVGGAIDIGARDATTDRSKVSAETSGLSGGVDIKLRENLLVGAGGGFGDDRNKIGDAGARVRGKSTILAAYASYQPTQTGFIDAMVGHGQLDFTTRRLAAAANATASGKRDGDYTVAALALGFDRSSGTLQWSVYGRGEYLDAKLSGYVETGADRYNLRFDARAVESLTGTIGGTIHYRHKVGFGAVTPHLRAEWNHEFADVDAQWLDYADIPGAAIYSLRGNGWKREQVQVSVGARFDILESGWSVDLESGLRAGQGEKAGSLQIKLSNTF